MTILQQNSAFTTKWPGPSWRMRWEIMSHESIKSMPTDWLLPGVTQTLHAFAVKSEGLHLLIAPQLQEASHPVAIYDLAELQRQSAWQEILPALHSLHLVDLAAYQQVHKQIEATLLLSALGKRVDYRALADWKEMAALDESSQELARKYDFHLNTLRLWDRLNPNHREQWLHIWQNRQVKKNLIREIIHDYYDLKADYRTLALQAAADLDQGWGPGIFPSEKLRDIVRDLRNPGSQQLRREVFQIKRAMDLPRQIQLSLPPDLEARKLELRLSFQNLAELETLIKFTSADTFRAQLQKILNLL